MSLLLLEPEVRASTAYIGDPSVTGLNLEDPSSAPSVIKTWDDRLDQEQYVESGVDDDVSGVPIR